MWGGSECDVEITQNSRDPKAGRARADDPDGGRRLMNAHVPVVRPGWPTGRPTPGPGPQSWPAYSYPAAAPPNVAATHRFSHRHVLSGLFGGLAGLVVILIIVSLVAKSAPAGNCQGLTCSVHPPIGPPVEIGQLYTNQQFKFTARVIQST